MSLRYKIFGIPANMDEVLTRAQETGEMLEVYATRQIVGTLVPNCQRFRYRVGVEIGKTRVNEQEWEKSFNDFVQGIDDKRFDFFVADQIAHKKAQRLAMDLAQKGILVLYGDEIHCSPNS